ncbi:GreA/GreB family elongation factor [Pedobacter sp. ASV28]|uniref:GreA/GreB family elongation factor n=1 Tax=Pedobacter sp. ASV28 TaxID=2795123 RepID=UPI0018EA3BF0|nr:GreA/GreB family elongation factor [Pedobacter sp. ASV28]
MNEQQIKTNQNPIILSRGIFDLLKIYVNKKKLSRHNEMKLEIELKYAKQVLRKDIPDTVVDINKSVKVKEIESGKQFTYHLVSPQRAKRKNNTISILSPIGIAMLGYKEGARLDWEMPEGVKSYEILTVSKIGDLVS